MLRPIRIDASSQDEKVRVIETIIIDPYCLPVTSTFLSFFFRHHEYDRQNPSNRRRLLLISKEIAYNLLGDLEVQGSYSASRTAKQGANRISLLDPWHYLRHKDEILSQDGSITIYQRIKHETNTKKSLYSKIVHQIHHQLDWILTHDNISQSNHRKKRRLPEPDILEKNSASQMPANKEGNSVQQTDKYEKEKNSQNILNDKQSQSNTLSSYLSNLSKIQICLQENEITIKESFLIDPNLDNDNNNGISLLQGCSSIDIANQIASDLNLPNSSSVPIATSIIEQLNGITCESSEQKNTGAWRLDLQEQMTMNSVVLTNHLLNYSKNDMSTFS